MSDSMQTAMPHGGDMLSFQERYGRMPLDFSASTNPYGLAPSARAAIIAALDEADCYPDMRCRKLTAAIAAREGMAAGLVVCGNGASDLIERLARLHVGKRALVCAPTFSEYEAALAREGCTVLHHHLRAEEGFALTRRVLAQLEGVDIVFLCEPNNPTGRVSGRGLLEEVLACCEAQGTLLVVDECFNGFLEHPQDHSLRACLPGSRHLVVLDAFTKLYGMAGVRLGYALCGSEPLAGRLREAGLPWGVSSLAQAAGEAALADGGYVVQTRALVARERKRIEECLCELGCTVYPSQANYLLFFSPAPGLFEALAAEGVLVRDCANFEGLGPGHYRVAVRLPQENDELLRAMARVLEG